MTSENKSVGYSRHPRRTGVDQVARRERSRAGRWSRTLASRQGRDGWRAPTPLQGPVTHGVRPAFWNERPAKVNSNFKFMFQRGPGSLGTSIILSSVPTTCLCQLFTTPNPRYQPHFNFYGSSICCDILLRRTVESIKRWTCCSQWSSAVIPARC